MSRSIDIGYYASGSQTRTDIEIMGSYGLFGTQRLSREFWSLPYLREIGVSELTQLGVSDPVTFEGWEMMSDLGREIKLLHQHMRSIEFYPELKARWLADLVYCHSLLISTAPEDSWPWLSIG